jgi:hypothetical protein
MQKEKWTKEEIKNVEPMLFKLRCQMAGVPEEKHEKVWFIITKVVWRVDSVGGFNPLDVKGGMI